MATKKETAAAVEEEVLAVEEKPAAKKTATKTAEVIAPTTAPTITLKMSPSASTRLIGLLSQYAYTFLSSSEKDTSHTMSGLSMLINLHHSGT